MIDFFLQGGLSGLAGKFPPSYMGAVVQGQALGGIFAAGSNVVSLITYILLRNFSFYSHKFVNAKFQDSQT